MAEVETNGHGQSNGHSKHKETEEERRVRKDKERKAKVNETEEERRIRKEKEKHSSSKHKETEEERRIRKEKEKQNGGERRKETDEERRIRKEKEKQNGGEKKRETSEERKIRKNKERGETEEERKARKEKEKAAKENGDSKKKETEEERRIRKEKEKNGEKRKETEEERKARKEKEKNGGHRKETEEERAARKEKERKDKKHETEEERADRKDREKKEKKEKSEPKEEMMELGDDYFAAEEERLNHSKNSHVKEESEEEETKMEVKEENDESDEDTKQGIIMQPVDSDDDVPLAKRKKPAVKRKVESGDDSEDEPLASKKGRMNREPSYDAYEDEEDDYERPSKKMNRKAPKKKSGGGGGGGAASPQKKMTKKEKDLEDEKKVWKWWEEDNALPEGVKWRFLEHQGPLFCDEYEPLPDEVRFWYDGKVLRLTEVTEECATFYGRMLDHDYTTKEVFNKNFFKDWRKTMTPEEKEIIRDLSKCDFSEIDAHFKKKSEERKARGKDEKNVEKEKNAQIIEDMGFCMMDGHREKIGNFRTEPPSLFRGRGEHPKQGMIKRRIHPEDVIINCSKDSKVPKAPEGHKWKKVQHDNSVTWLASWTENIQGQIKYIMLNPSSRLKGEKDWQKYEKARALKGEIEKIRESYMSEMKSKEMRVRQRAVALYFIDKLALRAGNEKDGDEQADTVGCCSLRVEHIELHEQKDGKEFVVEFDFLGKDSIRYNNEVAVDKKVYKNVKLFMENKKDGDDLFDRLNTSVLNQYLTGLMDGLTAKVFRTYNASFTLQQQLDDLTEKDDNVSAKMLSYNRANRAVAVLCNHQRAVPKTHEKSMGNLDAKLEQKQEAIKAAEKTLKHAKKAVKNGGGPGERATHDKAKKAVERLLEQLEKLEIQKTDKDENKTISLGTSKLNYLDPRISVQWCKTHEVPIEKVYNKTQREKFRWAIDMIMNDDEVFHF